MRSVKSNGSIEIGQSLEKDIEASIHALTPAGPVFHHSANGNGKMSGDNLGALLGQVSQASTREVDGLIGELRGLRKKLETDGERIQSDIVRYTELSQAVTQLTTIISDNVKNLPLGEANVDP